MPAIAPTPPAAPPAARRRAPLLPRLLGVLHRWADSGWSGAATATWTFLQSVAVPGPSAALLVPLGLAEPRRVWALTRWSIGGAVAGAVVAYAIGAVAFEQVEPLMANLGVDAGRLRAAEALFRQHGWKVLVVGSFMPLMSTKVVSLAAGSLGYPFLPFLLVVGLLRCAQLAFIGALIARGGERVREALGRRYGVPAPPAAPR